MQIDITLEPAPSLAEYAGVPSAFEVREIFEVAAPDNGLGGFVLSPRAVDRPYVKDYDVLPGEHPLDWAARFALAGWGFFAARSRGERVGGAAVALGAHEAALLDGRDDLALLWDIRIAPGARGQGVGAALFAAVETRARERGCRRLNVETQNVNVPACRFYARQGCVLGAVDRFAYPALPDEVQLTWYKDLAAG
jgi:GNAT superfamily N-acetyltransferase